MAKYINLFMWGYQEAFRIGLEYHANDVLSTLGIEDKARVLLVGSLAPNKNNNNAVCIEPEDEEWSLNLFDGLADSVSIKVKGHPLRHVAYGDELSNRDKPELIVRDSISCAVKDSLQPYDSRNDSLSFCGMATLVGDYYVVPVVQIPNKIFRNFPPLNDVETGHEYLGQGHRSLIQACLQIILDEASKDLCLPDPGRRIDNRRNADEIINVGAKNFMMTICLGVTNCYYPVDLLDRLNMISLLMYEGLEGVGCILLAAQDNPAIKYVVRFQNRIPVNESRWARKILQMTKDNICLIADQQFIYGLGYLDERVDSASMIIAVEFLSHNKWQIKNKGQVLFCSSFGKIRLPKASIGRERFVDNYSRLFPESSSDVHEQIWTIFNAAARQIHGTIIVIASDAESEAARLAQQGTVIEPVPLTNDLLEHAGRIDGAILVDSHLTCFAVGVILDGHATHSCTPSRGSRFNSATRYVDSQQETRMAIIVSEDHTVDIVPLLRPRISLSAIEHNISLIEDATIDNYFKPRNWIDENRFYFNTGQCSRVNTALDRIESLPRGMGQIMLLTQRLTPNELMNESYFLP